MASNPQQIKGFENSVDITNKFKEIVKSNGIQEPVAEVIVGDSGLKGENFGSQTHVVTIKFENPSVKPLNLFIKTLVDSEAHQKFVEEAKAFEKEARFFTAYLRDAREFCVKLGREDLMTIYPKCYYGDESLIVFENLVTDKNFILLNKEERQDFDAARFSIANYAKYHALSYAYIQHIGGSERFFKQYPNMDFEMFSQETGKEMMQNAVEEAISRDIEILENTEIEGKEKTLRILRKASGNASSYFLGSILISEEDRRLLVLNHGDAHTNNMMFQKDKETGKITSQILLDFQITRYASPCVDLHYFLFSSVQAAVRRTKLHELLKTYLEMFNKTCESLGYPVELSYEDFFQSFRRKAKLGFSMELTMNNGLGFKAMKTLDAAEIDFKDFGKLINTYIRKVLKENPEEKMNIAKDIVDLVEEYSNLSLDEV